VPQTINGFIDGRINLLVGDLSDFLCPQVKTYFKLLGHRLATHRRRNLLRRNRGNTDFLIGADWPAEELFDGGLHPCGKSPAL